MGGSQLRRRPCFVPGEARGVLGVRLVDMCVDWQVKTVRASTLEVALVAGTEISS